MLVSSGESPMRFLMLRVPLAKELLGLRQSLSPSHPMMNLIYLSKTDYFVRLESPKIDKATTCMRTASVYTN